MTSSMQGKVVVITGGAGMIGHAAAMSLAAAGADVMLVDINGAALAARRDAVAARGGRVETVVADVSRSADVQAYVARTLEVFCMSLGITTGANAWGLVAELVIWMFCGVSVKFWVTPQVS